MKKLAKKSIKGITVVSRILDTRISEHVENTLEESRYGFKQNIIQLYTT